MYLDKNNQSHQTAAYEAYKRFIVATTPPPSPPHEPRNLFPPQTTYSGMRRDRNKPF